MGYKIISLALAAAATCVAAPGWGANLTYTGSYSSNGYSATYSIIAPDTVGVITANQLSAVTTFSGPGFATYTAAAGAADLYIDPFGFGVNPLFVTSQTVGGNIVYSLNFNFTATNGVAAIYDNSASSPDGGISLCFQANQDAAHSEYGCNFSTSANAGFQDYSKSAFDFSNPVFVSSAVIATATVGSAVPEPQTWIMLILGFGGVGAAERYRKTARRVRFV